MPRCENPECGKEVQTVRRVVIAGDYDASLKKAIFLCADCSERKLRELKGRGYHVDEGIFEENPAE